MKLSKFSKGVTLPPEWIMEVSIGVIAYNEEKNIGRLLEVLVHQHCSQIRIKEILVVSDGSNDGTNAIIRRFAEEYPLIKPHIFQSRKGKYRGINAFISRAKADILVLSSADILYGKRTIESLCLPLIDTTVVMSIARGIPLNQGGIIDRCIHINWDIHHRLSLRSPKASELLAFKNTGLKVPKTIVDEEYLLALLKKQGTIRYVPSVTYFNKGPSTAREYVSQIRRYYAGHLTLFKKLRHTAITSKNVQCIVEAIGIEKRNWIYLFYFLVLQFIGRTLGLIDFIMQRNEVKWKIAKSTKELPVSEISLRGMAR